MIATASKYTDEKQELRRNSQAIAILGLLTSRGVPQHLLNATQNEYSWKAWDNKLVPVSILRDVCLTIGIDQIKDRQNFRNWVRESADIEGIPEGELTLVNQAQSVDILTKCLSRISGVGTDIYENTLAIIARNLLYNILVCFYFSCIMISLPSAYSPTKNKHSRPIKIETPSTLKKDIQYLVKAEIPEEFFYDLDLHPIDKSKLKNNLYLLEHIRDICIFLGLNNITDRPLVSKWLSRSLKITRQADSQGLSLLTFDQAVDVIAIALCPLIKIYSGQRVYVGSEEKTPVIMGIAENILLHIAHNSDFKVVLSKLAPEFRPKKRLKGGNYI